MANFYEVKITGKDTKRFLRNLNRRKIQLYKIIYEKDCVIIWISRTDYQKLKEMKTIYKIEVIDHHGILKLEYYLKKYSLFLSSLLIGLVLIYILSNLIFDIQIIHVKKDIRDLIRTELEKENVKLFHFQKSFDEQEKIVDRILTTRRETIEWLEIERIGTKYIVKVEERKYSNTDTETEPRDIIAKKDGRIIQIEAKEGTIIATKDQYVKKGDTLISGQIKNKDIVKSLVRSEGKVHAATWYTVTVSLPYQYQEEIKTGKSKNSLSVKLLSNNWSLFDAKSYKDKKVTPIFELKNNILPISISWNKEEEIKKQEKIYTKDLAILDALEIAREKIKAQVGEDATILYEKSLKITEENSKIEVEIFLEVKEDITAYQKTPTIQETEEKES